MKRNLFIMNALLLAVLLAGCDQYSKGNVKLSDTSKESMAATPNVEVNDKITQLQQELTKVTAELKEKDAQIIALQNSANQSNIVKDQFMIMQEKEAKMFQAAKEISAGNLPVKKDFGDPERNKILASIDYNSLDLADNEILLYVSVGYENEKVDETKPLTVNLTGYIHDDNPEAITGLRQMSLTIEKKNGKWVVTNFAKGN
ncbi:hypothetical protein ACFPPD_15770 [Cohnella suwonensis]|uniref:Lipoprotein n=1 Tax=Cohnella suwonensis TaxID=696072 RepID=A0ABW0LWC3_9BACL